MVFVVPLLLVDMGAVNVVWCGLVGLGREFVYFVVPLDCLGMP